MKQVAKLLIIDNNENYLLLIRDAHPVFGNDPDLPGGTLEAGEQPVTTMVREVFEEAGVKIDASKVSKLYEGTAYSASGTNELLYVIRVETRPEIHLSWEHIAYEWLSRADFLAKVKGAKDSYMRMVYAAVQDV